MKLHLVASLNWSLNFIIIVQYWSNVYSSSDTCASRDILNICGKEDTCEDSNFTKSDPSFQGDVPFPTTVGKNAKLFTRELSKTAEIYAGLRQVGHLSSLDESVEILSTIPGSDAEVGKTPLVAQSPCDPSGTHSSQFESSHHSLANTEASCQVEGNVNTIQEEADSTMAPVEAIAKMEQPVAEDIPSFREWTEKHLAQEEKGKGSGENGTNAATGAVVSGKMRKKNYASVDCGAKVLASSPDATSAGLVLTPSKDEYLLSTCHSKIWFVVELCEAVQLQKIDLANFELFSSSPRNFSILISDRFPSRDWTVVGQFEAQDEKSLQSFTLQPHLFTKYIKVEVHSHYGNQHFCPISMFRVFGTSELEVLEDESSGMMDMRDADDDEPIMFEDEEGSGKKVGGKGSKDLFGSARDAVMNIVKKAAEALVTKPNQEKEAIEPVSLPLTEKPAWKPRNLCHTPRHAIACKNCTSDVFDKLYDYVSCNMMELLRVVQTEYIEKSILRYDWCGKYGLESIPDRFPNSSHAFIYPLRLFSDKLRRALCHSFIVTRNFASLNETEKVVTNVTETCEYQNNDSIPESTSFLATTLSSFKILETAAPQMPPATAGAQVADLIKPTKTLEDKAGANSSLVESSSVVGGEGSKGKEKSIEVATIVEEQAEYSSASLDSLISELEKTGVDGSNQSQQPPFKPQQQQKESVFVRLANRIKALERNMSLSGQYLEELSRRYKKQVEDMQRDLLEVKENGKKNEEREMKQAEAINNLMSEIVSLKVGLNSLLEEQDSWAYKATVVGQHSLFVLIEMAVFVAVVCLCRGIPRVEISKRRISLEWRSDRHQERAGQDQKMVLVKRRQSLSIEEKKGVAKRRPSDEALVVHGSSHKELLINETYRSSKAESKRKRRKRKELLAKSAQNAINLEAGGLACGKKSEPRGNAPLSRCVSTSVIADENNYFSGEDKVKEETAVQQKRPLHIKMAALSESSNSSVGGSLPVTSSKERLKINGLKKIVKKFF